MNQVKLILLNLLFYHLFEKDYSELIQDQAFRYLIQIETAPFSDKKYREQLEEFKFIMMNGKKF
ncbi:unnamed protein product [Paramecium sonneborni]|uniref:Transposase InsH N-terminal domain-containing protein n=1 Tax=Paramecium sonneborni TaxID=65129 RepID=A0A8S1LNZ5_9CILI|nr:unnamed protein product [Paramecium sonneborni]